jgi:hypothetical protein
MKNKAVLKRLMMLSVIVFSAWLFWPATPVQKTTMNTPSISKPIIKPVSSAQIAISKKAETVTALPEKITSNDSATLVAKAYASELSFPPYSQPLTQNDFDRLEPNHFNPQSIPVDDLGNSVSASLSKYRYTYPEPVFATLSGENIANASLILTDITSGKILLTRKFEQDNNIWHAQFDGERNLPNQLQATVKANIKGKIISIALALKYVDSVATLESFDSATSQDADMVITANLTTREQGLYRVRANLFDANNQPIAHLVSKEKLNKGNASLELKAHQSVLQGRQAPFYLSTFSIELMSPAPGTPTKYGDSALTQFEIKDFATSSLSNLPYQPSQQEKQRLQLLQNMAQGR